MSAPCTPPRPDLLTPDQLAQALSLRDLSDPCQGPHALQLLCDEVRNALRRAWGCAVRVERTHPVVPVEDNYERLGYPPDAVTRDGRYTRYVSETCMLRSHCSAAIPPLLRTLAPGAAGLDVLLACPGIIYRRDVIGRYHSGTPHQLDLWRIVGRPMGRDDLLQMVKLTLDAVLPGREWRAVDTEHPYTVGGLEIEVRAHDGWVEVGECGVAAPGVLAAAGLDADVSGLAMGLGLDRMLMLRKGISDIRLLRSPLAAVAEQMLDLSAYRPVSAMPAVRRDLSVAWPADTVDDEQLGAQVRAALAEEADAVEDVAILSVTAYDDVPQNARERLGLERGQVNVLLRVVLRDLTRTLTDDEANDMRDRVYAALHGSATNGPTTAVQRRS